MPITNRTRADFLEAFPMLEPDHDFQLNGKPAELSQGRLWRLQGSSNEDDIFDYEEAIKGPTERVWDTYCSAISPDEQLLAISSEERILVYDIKTRELRQTLDGCGTIAFRPTVDNKHDDVLTDVTDASVRPAYTLVSSIPDESPRWVPKEEILNLWELDQHGRLLDEEEPIDADALATQAIKAILPQLETRHEWSKDFVDASGLHSGFVATLKKTATSHRMRHNTVLKSAKLGRFGSEVFSSDGKYLLYHDEPNSCNESDRWVVVFDIDAGKELYRLTGHVERSTWSGMSPDNKNIATIATDGLRMYSATTGELSWVANMGGQCWAGAFSPDSKHIVWSSQNGLLVQVLDVADGQLLSTFPGKDHHWFRWFKWHPDGLQIAMCCERKAFVWRPFDGPGGVIAQKYITEKSIFHDNINEVKTVSWMDGGRLLRVSISHGTTVVYDTHTNTKELFMRVGGDERDDVWVHPGFHGVLKLEDGNQVYISIDGDERVRYWNRCVMKSSPELDEKEQQEAPAQGWSESEKKNAAAKKPAYPETGKYVKVTKVARKEVEKKDVDKENWADKGAGLWTAE